MGGIVDAPTHVDSLPICAGRDDRIVGRLDCKRSSRGAARETANAATHPAVVSGAERKSVRPGPAGASDPATSAAGEGAAARGEAAARGDAPAGRRCTAAGGG